MQLEIRTPKMTLDHDLRHRVEDQLRRTLARLGEHVRRVDVELSDVNGPRGGIDKRAVISLRLRDGREVRVSELGESLMAAATLAGRRVRQSLARNLVRTRGVVRRARGYASRSA